MKHQLISLTNRLGAVAAVLLATAWLTGCGDDDENNDTPTPEPTLNIVEYAQEEDQLSTLVEAVGQADLATVLSDENAEFTVFAPNNSAFAAYLQANPDVDELSDIPNDVLADVLRYHVVSGTTLAADLENGSLNTLLDATAIEVNVDDGVVLNGSVQVIDADNSVSNGVVHVIDGVLNARTAEDSAQTIVDIVVEGDDFSILETAVTKFPDLVETLQGDGPLTVFGPTDAAFARFLEEDDRFAELTDIPDSVLKVVLQYHVLVGMKTAADLTAREATVQGDSLMIMKGDSVVINGNTVVRQPDVMASNGVIHVIDNVLLPPSLREPPEANPTIAEIAVATEDLSILVSALERAPDLLAAAGDSSAMLTVFAPTNEAFATFLEEDSRFNDLASIPDDVLTQVLQYHILASAKMAADLMTTEATLNGDSLSIAKSDDGVFINEDTEVTAADIQASNGVVHLIDRVLIPADLREEDGQTIAEIAVATEALSTLVMALQRVPNLLEAAGDPAAALTVFAPTNEAFAAFLESDPRFGSLDDIPDEVLAQVLQYHILASAKLAADLGETEETLLGETLSIDKTDGVVINGEVMVSAANIEASNGVVHLIDQVLVPPTLAPMPTIAAIATDTEALSILVQALQRTPDLLETAGNPDADITVFAPTNEAFTELLSAVGAESLDDIPDFVLRSVLEYHILGMGKLADELASTEETLEGAEISIDKSNGVVINGSSNVIPDLANIEAANGVVHVIDEVLLPPFITQILGSAIQPLLFDAEERFTTFLTALATQEELFDRLTDNETDGTLFVPTNAAFEDLIANNDAFGSVEDVLNAENLSEIMSFHVAFTKKAAADFDAPAGATHSILQNPNTEEGFLELYFSKEDDGSIILLGYATVVEADIMTPNEDFIIHAIESVLLPPAQSVVGVAAGNPAFGELVKALTRVQEASDDNEALLPLIDILSKERKVTEPMPGVRAPFTVFAPTDEAFAALYAALGVSGVAEVPLETLQAVLLNHVLTQDPPVFSTNLDLLENGTADTESGEITFDLSNLTIADGNEDNQNAAIIATDVSATNGVIHVIDQVLLPE